jgi:hypothetical protein
MSDTNMKLQNKTALITEYVKCPSLSIYVGKSLQQRLKSSWDPYFLRGFNNIYCVTNLDLYKIGVTQVQINLIC